METSNPVHSQDDLSADERDLTRSADDAFEDDGNNAEDEIAEPADLSRERVPDIDPEIVAGEWLRDELGLYYEMMWRYPILDHQELLRQFRLFQEQDSIEAGDRIVYSNVGLVISIAKRYVGKGIPIADLVQEGLLILSSKARVRFDPSRGYKFSTYATYWIRHAVMRAIQDLRTDMPFRVPVYVQTAIGKAGRQAQRCYATHGEWPDEMAVFSEVAPSAERAQLIAETARVKGPSLDRSAFHEGRGETFGDRFAHPHDSSLSAAVMCGEYENARRHAARIRAAISKLSPQRAEVIRRRYGLDGYLPQTLEEIRPRFRRTRERIRQIQAKACRDLASALRMTYARIRAALTALGEMEGDNTEPVVPASPSDIAKPLSGESLRRLFTRLSAHAFDPKEIGCPCVLAPVRTLAIEGRIEMSAALLELQRMIDQGWVQWIDGRDAVLIIRTDAIPVRTKGHKWADGSHLKVRPDFCGSPKPLPRPHGMVLALAEVPRLKKRRLLGDGGRRKDHPTPAGSSRPFHRPGGGVFVSPDAQRVLEFLSRRSVRVSGVRIVRGAVPLVMIRFQIAEQETLSVLANLVSIGDITSCDEWRTIRIVSEQYPDPPPCVPTRSRTNGSSVTRAFIASASADADRPTGPFSEIRLEAASEPPERPPDPSPERRMDEPAERAADRFDDAVVAATEPSPDIGLGSESNVEDNVRDLPMADHDGMNQADGENWVSEDFLSRRSGFPVQIVRAYLHEHPVPSCVRLASWGQVETFYLFPRAWAAMCDLRKLREVGRYEDIFVDANRAVWVSQRELLRIFRAVAAPSRLSEGRAMAYVDRHADQIRTIKVQTTRSCLRTFYLQSDLRSVLSTIPIV